MIDKQQLEKELNQTSITKRIDKKTFINALKAIDSNFINITLTKEHNQIKLSHPRTYGYLIYTSKD